MPIWRSAYYPPRRSGASSTTVQRKTHASPSVGQSASPPRMAAPWDRTIKESVLQIGHKITEPLWENTSLSIGFCVSGNCACMQKLVYQHADTDDKFFETFNYLYFHSVAFVVAGSPSYRRQVRVTHTTLVRCIWLS